MKIDSTPSTSLDCDKDTVKVIYPQKTPNRKSTDGGKEFKMAAVEDEGFRDVIRTTRFSTDQQRYESQRADESVTSGPPFFTSAEYLSNCVAQGNQERARWKNKELEANKASINNSGASTGVSKPALHEPIESRRDPPETNSPSTLLSSSLPSGSLLLLPSRGNALSLPPSPLFAPCDSPATSSSLTSLLERRRSKPGLKSLGHLSIFNSHNSTLDGNPRLQGQPPSKYDHHDSMANRDDGSKTTPTSISTGQFPVKILSDLYLGNAQTSADLHCLQSHNIGYIVNVTSDVINSFEGLPGFQYLRIPIADDSWSQDMEKHFRSAINFIDEGRKNNQSILIHCMAGVSRSVTVTVAYLMKSENLSMDDAYELLRSCKSNINPNLSLMGQLQLFGEKLKRERLKNQQHLLDVSSLSINQAAVESLEGQEIFSSIGESKFFKNCSTGHKINSNSHNSALITPETATFTDPHKPDNSVFNFPCTPPATPSLRDHFGIFQNRAMSLPNGNECEEL